MAPAAAASAAAANGALIRGAVVDTLGAPIEGAQVRVSDASVPPAFTDAAGRYRLTILDSGPFDLVLAAEGHEPQTAWLAGGDGVGHYLLKVGFLTERTVPSRDEMSSSILRLVGRQSTRLPARCTMTSAPLNSVAQEARTANQNNVEAAVPQERAISSLMLANSSIRETYFGVRRRRAATSG